MIPTYDEIFSRNLGALTEAQQGRIRSLKVAVAGCGGVGSPTAVCLARLGVGEIRVADPEVFEASNINRQFGAYVDTVGKSKAREVAGEIARINPHATIVCEDRGLTPANCAAFIEEADCVVDAIDIYATEVERVLHGCARRGGQWVFTGLQAGSVCVFTAFGPDSRSFEDLFCPDGAFDAERMLGTCFRVRPPEASDELIEGILSGQRLVLPFLATATMIAGGFVVESILQHVIHRTRPVVAPDVLLLELRPPRLGVFEAPEGGWPDPSHDTTEHAP